MNSRISAIMRCDPRLRSSWRADTAFNIGGGFGGADSQLFLSSSREDDDAMAVLWKLALRSKK
jgi:hypothetical protein